MTINLHPPSPPSVDGEDVVVANVDEENKLRGIDGSGRRGSLLHHIHRLKRRNNCPRGNIRRGIHKEVSGSGADLGPTGIHSKHYTWTVLNIEVYIIFSECCRNETQQLQLRGLLSAGDAIFSTLFHD
jgi:hypothetical protein